MQENESIIKKCYEMRLREVKKVLATLLAISLLLTGIPNVYATETSNDNQTIADEESDTESQSVKVTYVVVNSPQIEESENESIVVGIDTENNDIDNYTLIVEDSLGYTTELVSSKIQNDSVVFESTFAKGSYHVTELKYTFEQKVCEISMDEIGVDAVFGVAMNANSNPDAYVEDENSQEVEYSAVVMNEDGEAVSSNDISQAIQNSQEGIPAIASLASSRSKDVVVVLDPGHDADHPGARPSGRREEDYTFVIAQYAKAELEQYNGVTVYMTRSSSSCPHPGTDSSEDNRARVEYAKSVGADIYVSIHLNSSNNTSATGAEVYYPNTNYVPAYSTTGQELANSILSNLEELGLSNRGAKIRDADVKPEYPADQTYYPDGTVADYYGVIRNSKRNGFPGIIIEHAFLSSDSDYNLFLNSESKLKALGVADATGIAEYYNLSKEKEYEAGDAVVTATGNSTQTKYTITAAGISEAYRVSYAVWSEDGGQDDLTWYSADKDSNGNWNYTVPISNHSSDGKYLVDCYIGKSGGEAYYAGATSFTVSGPTADKPVISNLKQDAGTFDVTVSNASSASGISKVSYAVWSTSDQSNLQWYTAEKQSNGSYVSHIDIANHKYMTGTYHIEAYIADNNGILNYLGGLNQEIKTTATPSVTATGNSAQTTYTLAVSNATYPGMKEVRYAVWSKDGGQDDLSWCSASKGSDGKWKVNVSIKEHGTAGIYYVDAYAILPNGNTYIGGTTFNVTGPTMNKDPEVSNINVTAGTFDVTIPVTSTSGISRVSVPVWTTKNHSDLAWYTPTKQSDGTYKVQIGRASCRERV